MTYVKVIWPNVNCILVGEISFHRVGTLVVGGHDERGKASPDLFWKSEKCALILGKVSFLYLWAKCLIWNAVLKKSTEKKLQNVFLWSFFSVLQRKCLSKCSHFKKLSLPWKFLGCVPVERRNALNSPSPFSLPLSHISTCKKRVVLYESKNCYPKKKVSF